MLNDIMKHQLDSMSKRPNGDEIFSAVLNGELMIVLARGHKIVFRVRDRRLICSVCGNLSQPPAEICYGCEQGAKLVDPLKTDTF
jgi:hypothetical protein